jgi:predicted NUDIX family NTP pyrophosphohydrolase
MDEVKEVLVGVVKLSGKYLLIKRTEHAKYDPGRWEFVSLMVRGGEELPELEARVLSETGLKTDFIKEGAPFKVLDEYGEWLVRPFLFEAADSKVKLDDNHTDYQWVKKSELDNFETVADLKKNLDSFGDKKRSAGLVVYRQKGGNLEVLLVHPGGPFWARKDIWGLPKGEYEPDEDPLKVAKQEFEEEIGQAPPAGGYLELNEVRIPSGKKIKAWAIEGDLDVSTVTSNTIFIDWPPRSSKKMEIPEVDKADWIPAGKAVTKMHSGQARFIENLAEKLAVDLEEAGPAQSSLF